MVLQFLVTAVFAAFLATFYGFWQAVSGLAGGGICCCANAFFAGRLFVHKAVNVDVALQPRQILRHFYRSEALKIAFTLAMFVLFFTVIEVSFMPFIIAYALAALANWLFLPVLK